MDAQICMLAHIDAEKIPTTDASWSMLVWLKRKYFLVILTCSVVSFVN